MMMMMMMMMVMVMPPPAVFFSRCRRRVPSARGCQALHLELVLWTSQEATVQGAVEKGSSC
jgi:hypothetical protein